MAHMDWSCAVQIGQAKSAEDFHLFAGLVTQYVEWCRVRFAARPDFVDGLFGIQLLDEELRALPSKYSPPAGRAFLVMGDDGATGCIAYRRIDARVCEMKRLFVQDAAHGQGIGRRLCKEAITRAREDGFEHIRLDTLRLFTESIALYRSLGFVECAPYLDYPQEMLADVLFMQLRL